MAKQRYINTHFWDDGYIVTLDPIEKLLFIYLLTNPLTEISGAYEIPLRRIAFDTGIDRDMVLKMVARFAEEDKIIYRDGWVLICNFIKHQSKSPRIQEGIENSLNGCPDWIIDRVSIQYETLSHLNTYNSNSNSIQFEVVCAEEIKPKQLNGKSHDNPIHPSSALFSVSDPAAEILDGVRERMGVLILPRETEWLQHIDWAIANKFSANQFLGCYDYLKSQEWRTAAIRGEHVATELPNFANANKASVPKWQTDRDNCTQCDERGYKEIEGKHIVCKHV